jgi:O-antigen ligase
VTRERLTEFFFLATLVTVTWEKVRWEPAGGKLDVSEIFALCFLVLLVSSRIARRDSLLPSAAARVGLFGVAFLFVDLIGFYNLETHQALAEFAKGLGKFVIHFAFLVAGIAYVARRSQRFYWRSLGWFIGGIALNAAYGIAQLGAARAGHNLDRLILSPLTHVTTRINVYGHVGGSTVYRPTALTVDPNHLAIMLLLPLLVLAPVYLRLEQRHRLRVPLALLIAVVLGAELATLSRSGLLGLAFGGALLALPYRRLLWSQRAALPLILVAVPLLFQLHRRLHYLEAVTRSRLRVSGASPHFAVYGFIPDILHTHPLFGLGFNNFSVYYEFVTGKSNWGPHSFYVAILVEGGLVGTALYAVWLWYVFRSLRALRELGRRSAFARQAVSARVRPLSWGLTAALVATLAANAFYLTMTFFYFYVFLALALVALPVFERTAWKEEVAHAPSRVRATADRERLPTPVTAPHD